MDREIVQLEDNDDVDDGPQQQQDPAANVRVGESGDQEPAQQADLMGHAGTEDRAEADNAVFEAANWKGQSDPAAIGAAAPGRPAFAFPDDGSSQPKLPPPPDKTAPFTAEQQALFQRWQESMRKERRRKAATEAARRRREASKSTGTTGSSTSLNQPQQQHQGRGKKATPAAGKNSALKRSDLIKLLQGVAARKRRHPSPGKGGAKRKQEAGEDDHGNEDELDWKELGFGPEELAALEGEGEDEEVEDSEDPDDDEVVDLGEDEADYRRRREQRAKRGRFLVQEALLRRAELLKQPRQGIFVHMCGDCKARQKKAASFLYAPTNAENMSMLCIELCGECLERNILLAVSYKRAWVDNKVAVPQDLAHPLFIDRGPESTGSEDKRLMSFKFGWMLHQCAACQTYQKALAKDVFLQKKEADCFELTFMVCSMCCLANRDLQTSINRNFSGFADQRK